MPGASRAAHLHPRSVSSVPPDSGGRHASSGRWAGSGRAEHEDGEPRSLAPGVPGAGPAAGQRRPGSARGLLLAAPGSERDAAVSVLVGGACALLPNAWLALRARRAVVPGSELASAAGMFLAMLGKLAFTAALLALALARLESLIPLAFFGGFIVAIVAHHGAFLLEDAPGDT
ncbi:MAG: ATP synthase subunit I [Gammaproteobacteria bacterium]|nr:ATP synthase subunit I [Gammaproteobacteria bacterium]